MTLPRSCLSILRHRPIYRVSRERLTTLSNPDSAPFGMIGPGAEEICITRRSESGFVGTSKADSADIVWISLAPEGFVLPVCAPKAFGEPRVGVTAEPMNNWSIGQLVNWGAMPLGRRRTGTVRTVPRVSPPLTAE